MVEGGREGARYWSITEQLLRCEHKHKQVSMNILGFHTDAVRVSVTKIAKGGTKCVHQNFGDKAIDRCVRGGTGFQGGLDASLPPK